MNRWKRIALAALIAAGTLFIVLIYVGSRTSAVRELFEETMSERLDSKVEIGNLAVSLFPTMSVDGDNLRIRHRGRTDVPPLIEVRSFSAAGGFIGLWTKGHHLRLVQLDGLKLHIPPRRRNGAPNSESKSERDEGDDPGKDEEPGEAGTFEQVLVDRITSTDAELVLIPRRADKDPRVFAIHELILDSVGGGQVMPFRAGRSPTPFRAV